MYQQITIVGNVGRDAEMRYTPQGIAVCDFSVATNRTTGKGEARKQTTTWFKVTVWRERAEVAGQWIKKGMKIMVIGEIKASAYMAKDGTPQAVLELTAHDFKFLSRTDNSGEPGDDHRVDVPEEAPAAAGDEIPFD
jgi:single-strand DNA-binding protein